MINMNEVIKKDKTANKIASNIAEKMKNYDFICSVEMHSVLINKNIDTDIAIDILNKAIKKKYKSYKLVSSYTDYSGKFINQSIKENYYIGLITINKPYKSYMIGFYNLEELKNYSHEGLNINEMTLDLILEEKDI